ncbi:MAG: inorganic phosphate transporter [Arthrobacter sp.]|uniref:anion permease n=1 Tax=Arthrobacter sp. 179 TaxID=3457734 RepID=UPI0026565B76|nr:inorganic phosphate transporter [Micrococcaceae bacterium]MDN5904197.1 inorganic phosphate transporter [Micrococcaceae bacterium]MDN6169775.1 inorganic phosphate transporter [Micrococcaceae bacterium]MDN6300032.1 inorganic phosphate transporter [Micrococcaceae bacterium]
MDLTLIVVLVIALALFFDFTNGFHDTANAMATPIATGAIKPKTAVALAAVLNLVGAFLSTEVATTISGGLINEGDNGFSIGPEIIFAGLMGAVVWNMLTWLLGLPSSSSHALFGGLIGAAIAGAGFSVVNYGTVISKVLLPALLAPLIAGLAAYLCTKLAYWVTKRPSGLSSPKRGGFRVGQVFSSSLVALAHGTNDAQKTMGVITLALVASGLQESGSHVHFWVIAACALAIALGTYVGGWRIIATMGTGLTEVKPAQGFSAEASTAAAILASSHLGFALSTTQVASGSVIGSGLGRKGASVQWRTAGKIATGWLFTLPAAAVVGALAATLTYFGNVGLVLVAVIGFGVVLLIWWLSRKDIIGPHNGVSDVDEAGGAISIPTKKQRRKMRKRQREAERAEAERMARELKKAQKNKKKEANGKTKVPTASGSKSRAQEASAPKREARGTKEKR